MQPTTQLLSQSAGPQADGDRLRRAQAQTLGTPRRRYGVAVRFLVLCMDTVYGQAGSFAKYQVLELVARVPYQTWERVAYLAINRLYRQTGLARRVHERIVEAREQQDNEEWHLLIMAELAARDGAGRGWLRYRILPQLLATVYYLLSWLLFLIAPARSYQLNADFEDHAEHEYMEFVAAHPEINRADFGLTWNLLGIASMNTTLIIHAVFTRR